jgi:hypothetical protein
MSHDESITVGPWPDPPIPDFDSDGLMCPPWIKFPNLPRKSSGWRMGMGESYLEGFDTWWSHQARPVRLSARAKYPEPQEWSGFWQSRSGA